jgi:hypothetical protein
MATTSNPFDIKPAEQDQAGSTQTMSGATPLAQTAYQQYNPTPNLAPQTYTAQTSQVNAPKETMQGQLASILSKDNPLMQSARTMANQQMASRGLINSSMAAGASTAAMIDRALPIAQQDSQIYNNRALANQETTNQQNQFNVSQTNDMFKFGQEVASRYGLQTGQQQFDAQQNEAQRKFLTSERLGGQQFQEQMADLGQQYNLQTLSEQQRNELAKMSVAQNYTMQQMQAQFGFDVSKMDTQAALTLKQMDVNQRYDLAKMAEQQGYNLQTLSAQQINELGRMQLAQQFNLQSLSSQAQIELDRMSVGQQYNLLNLATQQGYNLQTLNAQQINNLQQMSVQQQYAIEQLNTQQSFQERMAALEQSGLDFRQARELASREMLVQLEQAGVTNRFDKELALKAEQFNVEQHNLEKRQIADNAAQLERLGLQINANRQDIPTSFAANISNTAMSGVNGILADPNMSPANKTTAINNLVNYANAQIAWAEKFYGTAIPRLSSTTTASDISIPNFNIPNFNFSGISLRY